MLGVRPGRLAVFAAANAAVVAGAVFAVVTSGNLVLSQQRDGIAAATRRLAVQQALARRNAAALTVSPARLEEMADRFVQGKRPVSRPRTLSP